MLKKVTRDKQQQLQKRYLSNVHREIRTLLVQKLHIPSVRKQQVSVYPNLMNQVRRIHNLVPVDKTVNCLKMN